MMHFLTACFQALHSFVPHWVGSLSGQPHPMVSSVWKNNMPKWQPIYHVGPGTQPCTGVSHMCSAMSGCAILTPSPGPVLILICLPRTFICASWGSFCQSLLSFADLSPLKILILSFQGVHGAAGRRKGLTKNGLPSLRDWNLFSPILLFPGLLLIQ